MIEWITEHWRSLTALASGSTILVWLKTNHAKIRAAYQWIVKQFHLSAENADLTKKLTAAQDSTAAAEARAVESDANVKKAEAERDVLAERLNPPLQPAEIEIIQFLAKHGAPIECYRLIGCFSLDRTRFEHHITRLTRRFYYITSREFADMRPAVYDLTDSGRAYAVLNSLC